jgi:type VI secretion system protein VasG
MSEISRSALFSKLNSLAFKSIESATAFCKLRGNPYVELVHWFHQILQLQDSDLHRVIAAYDVNQAHLAKDLTAALDRLPRGASSISDLSSHVEEAVERGWVYATLMFQDAQVRTGYLIVGILKTPGLRNALPAMSEEFNKVKLDDLCDRFTELVQGSPEDQLGATDGSNLASSPGEASGAIATNRSGKQEALERFRST